jgi:hypothetical protein
MPRYRLDIEYDGTGFSGWQRQAGQPSVQEAIETAIAGFCGEDVRIRGAGRTDAGVHALGQVAHVDLERDWPANKVMGALNARTHQLAESWRDAEHRKFAEEMARTSKTLSRFVQMSNEHAAFLVKKAGHVEAYARFLDEFKVEPVHVEFSCVSYRWGYAGTADLWVNIRRPFHGQPAGLWLVDLKTSLTSRPSAFYRDHVLHTWGFADKWPYGRAVTLMGPAGAGQLTKMVNQILISTMMIGVCEALLYGYKAGLDLETVMQSVSTGAAGSWSLSNLGPRMMANNFDPGFVVEHFIKDMGIALAESRRMGLSLPGLALAEQLYQSVKAKGWGRNGTHALMLALAEMSGIDWPNRK